MAHSYRKGNRLGRRGRAAADAGDAGRRAPGRRTLVQERIGTRSQPVQKRKASDSGKKAQAATTTEAAASGVSGSPGAFPHKARIEAALGVPIEARAHTGSSAQEACNTIGAEAYTVGPDVAFRSSSPDLRTAAHEAVHTVQQAQGVSIPGGVGRDGDSYERQAEAAADAVVSGGDASIENADRATGSAGSAVQRLSNDFRVTRTFEPEEDEEPDWADHVFFDLASADLDDHQKERLAAFVATLPSGPATELTLVGHSSEEGGDEVNARLASERIDSVITELVNTHGHQPDKITRAPRPESSQGRIAYRKWRSVEVDVGEPHNADCSVTPETQGFEADQRLFFNGACRMGQSWITTALSELDGHSPPPDLPPEVERLFGADATLDQVKGGIEKIQTQMSTYASTPPIVGTECHANCQGGMIAFVKGGSEMTVCPKFFQLSQLEAARALVHESAHFDSSVGAGDRAYGWERLIEHLPTAEALNNADSYALLIMRLAGKRLDPDDRPKTDDVSGLGNPDHEAKAEETIAYVQRWITASVIILNHLYAEVDRALKDSSESGWPSDLVRDKVRFAAHHLGFRFHSHPTEELKAILAGIYDRFHTMGVAVRRQSLTLTTTDGNSEWESGPGAHVAVNPSLWERSLRGRIRLLFRRLATATPDIRAGLVGGYVEVADDFRQVQGNGP